MPLVIPRIREEGGATLINENMMLIRAALDDCHVNVYSYMVQDGTYHIEHEYEINFNQAETICDSCDRYQG